MQADNGHFPANLGPYPAILVEDILFCPILMYEIDFYVQEESENTIGNSGKKFSEGGLLKKKISQKWPNFQHFWNCGHIIPKHKTKIDMDYISIMMNICVKLEKNLRWGILKIFKMGKIANMAIKWPKLKNVYFFSKIHIFIIYH